MRIAELSIRVYSKCLQLTSVLVMAVSIDSPNGYVGFGSINDTIRFDNVLVDAAAGTPATATSGTLISVK